MDAIRTIGKHGVMLQEYKGELSLTAAYEGSDGKFYDQWGKPKVGKDKYGDSDRPFKVILGDKAMAISVLTMILRELSVEPSAKPEEDIPF